MYKIILNVCVVILLSIKGVVNMFFVNDLPKIGNFSLSEYNDFISEFSSNIVLGPINNLESALEKAESVWAETFGSKIKNQEPHSVLYDQANKVWLIHGNLPKNYLGGVPNILI